jgi:hypothetical protein
MPTPRENLEALARAITADDDVAGLSACVEIVATVLEDLHSIAESLKAIELNTRQNRP